MTAPEVDIGNYHFVGRQGGRVVVLFPPRVFPTEDDALVFAAWIVALADLEGERFAAIFDRVRNT